MFSAISGKKQQRNDDRTKGERTPNRQKSSCACFSLSLPQVLYNRIDAGRGKSLGTQGLLEFPNTGIINHG